MKRLMPVTPILLLLALLLSPGAALAGAKQGLSLWWGSVFPSLLPSFICLKLKKSGSFPPVPSCMLRERSAFR